MYIQNKQQSHHSPTIPWKENASICWLPNSTLLAAEP
jgi:hypothetical protein